MAYCSSPASFSAPFCLLFLTIGLSFSLLYLPCFFLQKGHLPTPGMHYLLCSWCCSVAKLCLTLCDPMDCSTRGSSSSTTLGVYSNSYASSAISSSVISSEMFFLTSLIRSLLNQALTALGTSLVVAVVQSLSCVWIFATPWTAAHQVSLCFMISQSLL